MRIIRRHESNLATSFSEDTLSNSGSISNSSTSDSDSVNFDQLFLIKVIRADERCFIRDFALNITPTIENPHWYKLRKCPKPYVVYPEGVYKRPAKPEKYTYTDEQLIGYSQTQATTLRISQFTPVFRPRSHTNKLLGIQINIKDAYLERMFSGDYGTHKRPYEFYTEKEAQKYYKKYVIKKKRLYGDLEEFIEVLKEREQAYLDLPPKFRAEKKISIHEVLAKLRWNIDGSSAVCIFSDDFETRCLAMDYARIIYNALKVQYHQNKEFLEQEKKARLEQLQRDFELSSASNEDDIESYSPEISRDTDKLNQDFLLASNAIEEEYAERIAQWIFDESYEVPIVFSINKKTFSTSSKDTLEDSESAFYQPYSIEQQQADKEQAKNLSYFERNGLFVQGNFEFLLLLDEINEKEIDLSYHDLLLKIIKAGSFHIAESLLEKHSEIANTKFDWKESPHKDYLHVVSEKGYIHIFNWYLQSGAKLCEHKFFSTTINITPAIASANDRAEILKRLTADEANSWLLLHPYIATGLSPLFLAAIKGNQNSFKVLLQFSNISLDKPSPLPKQATDLYTHTHVILALAVYGGNKQLVNWLLQHNAYRVEQRKGGADLLFKKFFKNSGHNLKIQHLNDIKDLLFAVDFTDLLKHIIRTKKVIDKIERNKYKFPYKQFGFVTLMEIIFGIIAVETTLAARKKSADQQERTSMYLYFLIGFALLFYSSFRAVTFFSTRNRRAEYLSKIEHSEYVKNLPEVRFR